MLEKQSAVKELVRKRRFGGRWTDGGSKTGWLSLDNVSADRVGHARSLDNAQTVPCCHHHTYAVHTCFMSEAAHHLVHSPCSFPTGHGLGRDGTDLGWLPDDMCVSFHEVRFLALHLPTLIFPGLDSRAKRFRFRLPCYEAVGRNHRGGTRAAL